MTAKNNLEQELYKLGQALASDDSFVHEVMHRIEADAICPRTQSVQKQRVWRRLMMTRAGEIAAAAAVIIGGFVGVRYLTGSFDGAPPAYGITEAAECLTNAKTIHAKGWNYFPSVKMPDGSDVPPTVDEMWFDLENGRSRTTTYTIYGGLKHVDVSVGEVIEDGEYLLSLSHTDKTAYFRRFDEFRHRWAKEQPKHHMPQAGVAEMLLGDVDKLDSFVKIGRAKIEGVICDIWEHTEFSAAGAGTRTRCWLSPTTGEAKKVQFWMKFSHREEWGLSLEYDQIEVNAEIPEWVFATEVPEGYEAENTKETAPVVGLYGYGGLCGNGRGLWFGLHIYFTLCDGSVILAWNSVDTKSETPQIELFKDLEFGGPLPKVPDELYALKPRPLDSDITYTGYHLTYTEKDGKFIEWSLYVPNAPPPPYAQLKGYDMLTRGNPEPGLFAKTPPIPRGLLIETSQDFDTWVLGAMAELSDEGKAPEGLTYQRVMNLAEEIRRSLTRKKVQDTHKLDRRGGRG